MKKSNIGFYIGLSTMLIGVLMIIASMYKGIYDLFLEGNYLECGILLTVSGIIIIGLFYMVECILRIVCKLIEEVKCEKKVKKK